MTINWNDAVEVAGSGNGQRRVIEKIVSAPGPSYRLDYLPKLRMFRVYWLGTVQDGQDAETLVPVECCRGWRRWRPGYAPPPK